MGLSYMQTAEALSSILKSNDTLREIDSSGNALGIEGGRSLREALTDNMYVHRLSAFLYARTNAPCSSMVDASYQGILFHHSSVLV